MISRILEVKKNFFIPNLLCNLRVGNFLCLVIDSISQDITMLFLPFRPLNFRSSIAGDLTVPVRYSSFLFTQINIIPDSDRCKYFFPIQFVPCTRKDSYIWIAETVGTSSVLTGGILLCDWALPDGNAIFLAFDKVWKTIENAKKIGREKFGVS